jgi:SAM-dependent methyltransferase
VVEVGRVEYLAGFDWMIWDCAECGCRFTMHDHTLYDRFHSSGAISYYSDYRQFAANCRALFDEGDTQALRTYLSRTTKYGFVIGHLTREPLSSRLLEVGCSRGYLTSCFILEGRHILGVDVSSEAIDSARAAFGEHFALADSPAVAAGVPYDVIYHVGMIGCVADPVGFTTRLLSMLKPGGRLLFNAPNRSALHLRGQLWLDSAPPPDLVTLFPEHFWTRYFSGQAEVIERIEMLTAGHSAEVSLRNLCGRRWRKPVPRTLERAANAGHTWAQQVGGPWRLFERVVLRGARFTGLERLVARRRSDFGQFVAMTTK